MSTGEAPIPPAGPRLDLIEDADLPRRFGRYVLRAIVGRGGMGRVFRAELLGPAGFCKTVALKVILQGAAGGSAVPRAEFEREARIGGLLRHPNIVDVYDFGFCGEQPWLALELIEGATLAELLGSGPAPPVAALELALQILEGLDFAHRLEAPDGRGVVHRDIKPSNVMVTVQGAVKVMDFGIAGFAGADEAAAGWSRGTPSYMSPEQARCDAIDPRSDLFSFGLLLYEAVTGQRLLAGADLPAIIFSLVSLGERLFDPSFAPLVNDRVPGLAPLLVACLQQEPAARPPSARALLGPLRSLLAQLPPGPGLRAWLEGGARPGEGGATDDPTLPLMGSLPTRPLPTAPPTPPRPGNIGPERDSFVGRQADLGRLGELLDGARLLTVLGPGGTGKTRLVRRHGRDRIDAGTHPPGGIWFCDLSEAFGLPGMVHALASVLDVPLERQVGEGEAVTRLGAALAGRGPTLLILDNFEQVVEHGPATVARWLELAPALRVVVTSRELLHLTGERVLDLAPLPAGDAAKLFLERARSARPGFDPRTEESVLIDRIVARLDGIPLAIELAAARCSVLSVASILERLQERFRLLAGRSRDRSPRQATLRGAIDWSWDLLEPWERGALATCSVFRGGFDLEQAERVIRLDRWPDAPWVLDVVQALRDKSLLRSQVLAGGGLRFGLYESVREYAREKLASEGDGAGDQERHADVFLRLGEELVLDLDGAGARAARQRLEREAGNVAAVLERSRDRDAEHGARAVLILHALYRLTGPVDAEAALLEDAVERASSAAPGLRAKVHIARAHLRRLRGEEEGAKRDLTVALGLAREGADRETEVRAQTGIAYLAMVRGDLEESAGAAEAAQALARTMGGRRLRAEALSCLAFCRGYQERDEEAEGLHRDAHDLFAVLGDQRLMASQLNCLAIIHASRREMEAAERLFDEARRANREVGYRRGEAQSLGNLAICAVQRGRYAEAEEALTRAIEIDRRIGDRHAESLFLVNQACAVLLQGRRGEGEASLGRGEQLMRDSHALDILVIALRAKAALACRDGDFGAAMALLDETERVQAAAPWVVGQATTRGLRFVARAGRGEDGELPPEGDAEDRALLTLCRTWASLLGARGVVSEAARTTWRRWGFEGEVDPVERAPEALHHLVHMLVGEVLDGGSV